MKLRAKRMSQIVNIDILAISNIFNTEFIYSSIVYCVNHAKKKLSYHESFFVTSPKIAFCANLGKTKDASCNSGE